MVTHVFSPAEDNRMLGPLKDHGPDKNNVPLRLPTSTNTWGKFSAVTRTWFIIYPPRQTWEGPRPTGESCSSRFSVMIRRVKVSKDSREGLHLPTGKERQ